MSLSRRGTFIILIENATTNVDTYRKVAVHFSQCKSSVRQKLAAKVVKTTEIIFMTDQGINHIFPAVFTVL